MAKTDLEPIPVSKPRKRLTADEQITLATLIKQNVPLATIAEQLGTTEKTLRSACQDARALLETASLAAAQDWIEASRQASRRGFHQPAKDLLQAVNVIEMKPRETVVQAAAPQIQVNVGFNLPGLPAPQAPPKPVKALPPKPVVAEVAEEDN